jgi:hypothetical protein
MEPQAEQQETQAPPTLINHAAKWGLISGAISIFLVVVIYVVDYTMLAKLSILAVFILLALGIVAYAGIDYRKQIGGYLSFGKAWQHNMVVFLVSGVIGTIFNILLYTVIDSELPTKMADAIVDNTREMMENFGAPADQIDEALEKTRTDSIERFTAFGMVKGFAWQLIGYAIFSCITALFGRKNPPVDQM